MKKQAEKMVEQAIKTLLATAERNREDVSTAMDRYEETHDELECSRGKNYNALVDAHNKLENLIEMLNNAIK